METFYFKGKSYEIDDDTMDAIDELCEEFEQKQEKKKALERGETPVEVDTWLIDGRICFEFWENGDKVVYVDESGESYLYPKSKATKCSCYIKPCEKSDFISGDMVFFTDYDDVEEMEIDDIDHFGFVKSGVVYDMNIDDCTNTSSWDNWFKIVVQGAKDSCRG